MKGPLCAPPPGALSRFSSSPFIPWGSSRAPCLLLTDLGPHPVFMEVFPLLFMGAALLYAMNNK